MRSASSRLAAAVSLSPFSAASEPMSWSVWATLTCSGPNAARPATSARSSSCCALSYARAPIHAADDREYFRLRLGLVRELLLPAIGGGVEQRDDVGSVRRLAVHNGIGCAQQAAQRLADPGRFRGLPFRPVARGRE